MGQFRLDKKHWEALNKLDGLPLGAEMFKPEENIGVEVRGVLIGYKEMVSKKHGDFTGVLMQTENGNIVIASQVAVNTMRENNLETNDVISLVCTGEEEFSNGNTGFMFKVGYICKLEELKEVSSKVHGFLNEYGEPEPEKLDLE